MSLLHSGASGAAGTRRTPNNDARGWHCSLTGVVLVVREIHGEALPETAGLSLLFAAGTRPSAADIERLFAAPPAAGAPTYEAKGAVARISNRRGAQDGWLELLASGLTFDLHGLAEGEACPVPPTSHFFGLPRDAADPQLEAITLLPGPHLSGGGAMLPVVKTMAVLAGELAANFQPKAVCWQPAASCMAPDYFARIVAAWRDGGAFPALGLCGVERQPDGTVETVGLAFLVGHELRVEPRPGEPAAETVKLAVRMIDHLTRHGPIQKRETLTGPRGEALIAEPASDGGSVRLWRDA